MLSDDAQNCTALSVSYSLVMLKTQQNKLKLFSALASADRLALTAISDSHCQGRAKRQWPEPEFQMRNYSYMSMKYVQCMLFNEKFLTKKYVQYKYIHINYPKK